MKFSDNAIKKAVEFLDVPSAAVKAAAFVESGGEGFLKDGRPKVLFEAHHFSRLTGGRYDKTHPNISSPHWDRSLYAEGKDSEERGAREHERLAAAAALDRKMALQACSWGAFQVMGFNWRILGYEGLQGFVNAMHKDADAHLDSFVRFVKVNKLDDELRDLNFGRFALGYNGPSYKANKYDTKLANAYALYVKEESSVKNK